MNLAVYNAGTNHVATVVSEATGELPPGYEFVPEAEVPENANREPIDSRTTPASVKLHALRSVFGLRGFTTKIDRTISNLPEPNKTIAANHWNYGDEIRRDHPLVAALTAMLTLTEVEVDEIFRDAQTIMDGGVPDTKPEEITLWERLTSLFS